jgi:hypothetical protein
VWYQVDAGDADLATFFYFLGQAAPRRRRPLPLLTPEYRADRDLFARRFFREFYKRFRASFAIVLDNYQETPADAVLHEVVRAAAEELPQGGRLIIISRTEPPASLARLRVHQTLDVIDWTDLRLTPTEAAMLARRSRPGGHTATRVRKLYELSDGWAAGMTLLLNQRGGGERSPSHGRDSQVLFDYFAAEIFSRADAETRDILLQTSLLPVVQPSVAVELTGSARAAHVIEALHRASYFTNKRAGPNAAYEYHPMFREFLVAQAHQIYSPARLSTVRSSAARLVEQAGDVPGAADLLITARDWDAMAPLVCRHAPSFLAQGRLQTVNQWLARMPDEVCAGAPWLLFWRGVCQLGNDHDACRSDCERALAAFRNLCDIDGALLSWSIIVTSLLMEGRLRPLDDWIAVLDQLRAESPGRLSPQIEARVATTMIVAIVFRQPQHPDGAWWAECALAATDEVEDLSLRGLAAFGWFMYHWTVGNTSKASLVIDEMRVLSRRRDIPSVFALHAAVSLVWSEMFQASPTCRHTVADIREHARATGLRHTLTTSVLAYGAFSVLTDGDLELARAWIRELGDESATLGPTYTFAYHGLVALEALARDDVQRASTHVEEMARLGYTTGYVLEEIFSHTVAAYVCSRQADYERALAHLRQALDVSTAGRVPLGEWFVRLAEAHVWFASGRQTDGLRALATAMTIGRTHGYVNSQVWLPTIMAPLCARALDAGIEVDYVRDLVRRRRLVCDPPPLEVEAWPWPLKIVVLGRFAVLKDDRPVRSVGKVQRKPLALLKALVAHGSAGVREQRVMDALWPDAEGDAARRALTTAVFRLRRLLGHEAAVVRHDGWIGLNPARCWVDLWAVERLIERAERAAASDDPAGAATLAERAAALHRAPLVASDDEVPTRTTGDRLRRRLVRQLVAAARWYSATERPQRALDMFELAAKLDPSVDTYMTSASRYCDGKVT